MLRFYSLLLLIFLFPIKPFQTSSSPDPTESSHQRDGKEPGDTNMFDGKDEEDQRDKVEKHHYYNNDDDEDNLTEFNMNDINYNNNNNYNNKHPVTQTLPLDGHGHSAGTSNISHFSIPWDHGTIEKFQSAETWESTNHDEKSGAKWWPQNFHRGETSWRRMYKEDKIIRQRTTSTTERIRTDTVSRKLNHSIKMKRRSERKNSGKISTPRNHFLNREDETSHLIAVGEQKARGFSSATNFASPTSISSRKEVADDIFGMKNLRESLPNMEKQAADYHNHHINAVERIPVVYINVTNSADPIVYAHGQQQQRTGLGIFWGLGHPDWNIGICLPMVAGRGGEVIEQRAWYTAALIVLRQAVKWQLPALVVKIAGSPLIAEVLSYYWSARNVEWRAAIFDIGNAAIQNMDLVLKLLEEMHKFPIQQLVHFVPVKEEDREFGYFETKRLAMQGIQKGKEEAEGQHNKNQQVIKALCQEFGEDLFV